MRSWISDPAEIRARLENQARAEGFSALGICAPDANPHLPARLAAFLAAVTQAPLTAFIIVMEMVDGHALVLSLMASAMLASLVSRMISRPLYETLSQHMIATLVPAAGAANTVVLTTAPPAPPVPPLAKP